MCKEVIAKWYSSLNVGTNITMTRLMSNCFCLRKSETLTLLIHRPIPKSWLYFTYLGQIRSIQPLEDEDIHSGIRFGSYRLKWLMAFVLVQDVSEKSLRCVSVPPTAQRGPAFSTFHLKHTAYYQCHHTQASPNALHITHRTNKTSVSNKISCTAICGYKWTNSLIFKHWYKYCYCRILHKNSFSLIVHICQLWSVQADRINFKQIYESCYNRKYVNKLRLSNHRMGFLILWL